ncbi:MAG: single-stranded DNA-binding protein [Candidatus Gastranaerophilales bacterium]|nr:single-stranded DNA-binding protein [Candidatus Gastranaerophilales bacterium]
MSVAKAVISGIAVRDAEKRFTTNDLAVLNFTMNINEQEETLLRVVMMGKLAESADGIIKKGSIVTVEGRLQTNTFKDSNGEDKKIIELVAQNFDVAGKADVTVSTSSQAENDYNMPDDVPEELIGDEEIPF